MRKDRLSADYLKKARVRLKALYFYKEHESYSDVVRGAQELVELLLKAVLRSVGVEAPKVHDVSRTLERYRHLLPEVFNRSLNDIKRISKRLRKERELSFYGAEDFIPTEEYDLYDAEKAIREAEMVFQVVQASFAAMKQEA